MNMAMNVDIELGSFELSVSCLDSMEEAESECTNHITSFKVGERLYQYYGLSQQDAVELFIADIKRDRKLKMIKVPKVVFGVVANFKQQFVIDWDAIER